jgi:ribosomal protein S18 acetylase RimI-like enzyme
MNIEISAVTKAEKDSDTGIKFSDGHITIYSGKHNVSYEYETGFEDQYACDGFVYAEDTKTNKIVGYAVLKFRENGELHIDCMQVHSNHQKTGIGSLIYEYIEKHAKDFKTLSAQVFDDNPSGQGFFQAKGFNKVGKIERGFNQGRYNAEGITIYEKPVEARKSKLTLKNQIGIPSDKVVD